MSIWVHVNVVPVRHGYGTPSHLGQPTLLLLNPHGYGDDDDDHARPRGDDDDDVHAHPHGGDDLERPLDYWSANLKNISNWRPQIQRKDGGS